MIHYGDSRLSLGVWIGIPILVIVLGCCIAAMIWAWRNSDTIEYPRLAFLAPIGVGFITLIIYGIGFYPYSGEYHHWQTVSGKVTSTNSRFLASTKGNGTDQKFVVTFQGSTQQFGCNDTRCATVRKGDELTITCKRVFQFFGTPGYDCNFVSIHEQ